MIRNVQVAAIATFIALAAPHVARAQSDTYVETFTATGSLDGNSFSDATVTFTATANPNNIAAGPNGTTVFDLLTSLSVTVGGETELVSGDFSVFSTQGGVVGVSFASNGQIAGDIVDLGSVDLIGYALNSAVSATADGAFGNGAFTLDVGDGNELIVSSFGGPASWTEGGGTGVPEPGSLAIVGGALIAFAGLRRRAA